MNTTNDRRRFLKTIAASMGAVALMPLAARAQAPAGPVTENDPTAMALGYKADTTKVDGAKYPQHKADQKCSGCMLYTGKPGEKQGPCSAFANKLVAADGWCMAFAKKPA